ncbi:protein of unknown function [Streptomyces murinus]
MCLPVRPGWGWWLVRDDRREGAVGREVNILDYSHAVTLDAWTFTQRSQDALPTEIVERQRGMGGIRVAAR